jgi:prephenate dehydratase
VETDSAARLDEALADLRKATHEVRVLGLYATAKINAASRTK